MNTNANILVLTQWSYKDALVQTYTLPYVEIMRKIISSDRKIFVVTAEQSHLALSPAEVNQINYEWSARNMCLVPQTYRSFSVKKIAASVRNIIELTRIIRKERVRTIHAFCTPAGSIAYLLSKFSGADLVIDSYEPHAEAMVENGTWKRNGLAFQILFRLEKLQSRQAKTLIAASSGMKQYALEKYDLKGKIFFVKPACVDFEKFSPNEKNRTLLKEMGLENKIICVYAGKLGGIYLKEEVFDFIKACYNHWNDEFRFLLLTNSSDEIIKTELQRTELPQKIVLKRFVYHNEIPNHLSLGDFAINPVKPVPTKRFCTSIKDGEYWAMGLPVMISPNISDDSDIIRENKIGVVADFRKKEELPEAVRQMDFLLKNNTRESLQKKIFEVAKKYRSFDIARKIYPMIYE